MKNEVALTIDFREFVLKQIEEYNSEMEQLYVMKTKYSEMFKMMVVSDINKLIKTLSSTYVTSFIDKFENETKLYLTSTEKWRLKYKFEELNLVFDENSLMELLSWIEGIFALENLEKRKGVALKEMIQGLKENRNDNNPVYSYIEKGVIVGLKYDAMGSELHLLPKTFKVNLFGSDAKRDNESDDPGCYGLKMIFKEMLIGLDKSSEFDKLDKLVDKLSDDLYPLVQHSFENWKKSAKEQTPLELPLKDEVFEVIEGIKIKVPYTKFKTVDPGVLAPVYVSITLSEELLLRLNETYVRGVMSWEKEEAIVARLNQLKLDYPKMLPIGGKMLK